MAKPARVWPLGTIRIFWTHNGWFSQFGLGWHWSIFKKTGCKDPTGPYYLSIKHTKFYRELFQAHNIYQIMIQSKFKSCQKEVPNIYYLKRWVAVSLWDTMVEMAKPTLTVEMMNCLMADIGRVKWKPGQRRDQFWHISCDPSIRIQGTRT